MHKIIFTLVLTTILASCSSTLHKNTISSKERKISIIGIWAMLPLRNGIANVVEFTKEGRSNLHPFNCRKNTSGEVESSIYTISDDGMNVRLDSGGEIQNLSIISINNDTMFLEQKAGNFSLKFAYVRSDRVSPLCSLYKESKEDASKRTAFNKTDFTHDPWVPDNPNISRYAGKWADENGAVQIEVIKDDSGRYKIYMHNNENWNHLYNNVHWSGVELRFQSFAYSDKHDLFDHPFHKSGSMMILTPVDDANKIKWSFYSGAKRYDYILIRK